VPKNISLIFLPSRSPELNPVENVWQYLRANWLSNRVFDTYGDIIDAACDAWNRLVDQPGTITSTAPAANEGLLNRSGIFPPGSCSFLTFFHC
jgi:hypothetical protein